MTDNKNNFTNFSENLFSSLNDDHYNAQPHEPNSTDNDLVDEEVSDDTSMEFGTTDNDLVDEEVSDDTSM
ncbi:MAG: hypothetical protein CMD26_02740, partial [Flavobacteriales bacterium]|nr:hypothetical protein [Flavobacteriales bacterium]